jgi:hypothetical protein
MNSLGNPMMFVNSSPGGWILIEQLPMHRSWRRHYGVTFAIGPRAVTRYAVLATGSSWPVG